MMTIITETAISPGQEPKWDSAFQQRMETVRNQPGFVTVQLLIPVDEPNHRIVMGTWQTRADWEAWHNADEFRQTREQMDEVEQSKTDQRWFEVVNQIAAE
jgi:heme-degrading monooxygenase HmoA